MNFLANFIVMLYDVVNKKNFFASWFAACASGRVNRFFTEQSREALYLLQKFFRRSDKKRRLKWRRHFLCRVCVANSLSIALSQLSFAKARKNFFASWHLLQKFFRRSDKKRRLKWRRHFLCRVCVANSLSIALSQLSFAKARKNFFASWHLLQKFFRRKYV